MSEQLLRIALDALNTGDVLQRTRAVLELEKALVSHGFDRTASHSTGEYQDATTGPDDDGWVSLTDADRERAFNSLPDMLDGFLKKWGWLHFAQAIEDICREKNLATQPQAPQGAVTRHCDTCGHMVSAPCRSVICSTRDTWKSAAAPETPEGKK